MPVDVDAPPPVVVPTFAPAIAPIEVLPPELPEALEAVHTLATACCSAAFSEELDEAPEDEAHVLLSPDGPLPDAALPSAALAD